MKAITLWQPWASLIAEGVKTIETRPKQHPWRSAIGQTIAIHAAKREPAVRGFGDYAVIPAQQWQRDALREEGAFTLNGPLGWQFMPLGAVVATSTLVDVVPMVDHIESGTAPRTLLHLNYGGSVGLMLFDPSLPLSEGMRRVEDQRPFGDYAAGWWALLLDNIVKLPEPIPARGFQGLWSWEPAEVHA